MEHVQLRADATTDLLILRSQIGKLTVGIKDTD